MVLPCPLILENPPPSLLVRSPTFSHNDLVLQIAEIYAGYIGRFLAQYIHENSLCSEIRIVDKVLPQLAHLAPEHEEPCSPSVFVQADASRETSIARVFDRPNTDQPWDFVFNLGGETAWAQPAEIYRLRNLALSVTLGKEAARRRVKAFVEASTGMVYSPGRTPRKETDKLKPWMKLARSKLEAEEELSRMQGLNLVILRLAHVYGPYDSAFIAKALCLARVYQEQGRELEWLWTEDLRINTVHVEDVARAFWRAAEWRAQHNSVTSDDIMAASVAPSPTTTTITSPSSLRGLPNGHGSSNSVSSAGRTQPNGVSPLNPPIFNIVDHGNTSQGDLAKAISHVFHIKTGFQGTLISHFAKMHLDSVVDQLNEEVLQPWADLLAKKQITRPGPLSPFMEKQLLKDNDLSMDGTLFEKVTGFEYQKGVGGLDAKGIQEMVDSYERMGWWP